MQLTNSAFDSYLETLLWASSDILPNEPPNSVPKPLDQHFDSDDIDSDSLDLSRIICQIFLDLAGKSNSGMRS
jgi:hypothetical protein